MQITEFRQSYQPYLFGRGGPISTRDEEIGEALESVLSSIAAGGSDPDRAAAASRLLRHLVRAAAQ